MSVIEVVVGLLERYRDRPRRGKHLAVRYAVKMKLTLPPDFCEQFYRADAKPEMAMALVATA